MDITSDSQVNSNFPNRWSPAKLLHHSLRTFTASEIIMVSRNIMNTVSVLGRSRRIEDIDIACFILYLDRILSTDLRQYRSYRFHVGSYCWLRHFWRRRTLPLTDSLCLTQKNMSVLTSCVEIGSYEFVASKSSITHPIVDT